jgi:hypothetical protein
VVVLCLLRLFAAKSNYAYCARVRRGFAYRAKGLEAQAKQDFSVAIPVMINALKDPVLINHEIHQIHKKTNVRTPPLLVRRVSWVSLTT